MGIGAALQAFAPFILKGSEDVAGIIQSEAKRKRDAPGLEQDAELKRLNILKAKGDISEQQYKTRLSALDVRKGARAEVRELSAEDLKEQIITASETVNTAVHENPDLIANEVLKNLGAAGKEPIVTGKPTIPGTPPRAPQPTPIQQPQAAPPQGVTQAQRLRAASAGGEFPFAKGISDVIETDIERVREVEDRDLKAELDRDLASLRIQATEQLSKRKDVQQQRLGMQGFVKTVGALPTLKALKTMGTSASRIKLLLEQRNPVVDEAMKTQLARMMGEVGAISDADKEAFGGSKAIADRMGRYSSRQFTGQITEKDRDYIRDLADTMLNTSRNGVNNIITKAKDIGSDFGLDEKQISNALKLISAFEVGDSIKGNGKAKQIGRFKVEVK